MYTARSSPIFINAYTVVRPTRRALAASSGVSSNWSLGNASEERVGVSCNVAPPHPSLVPHIRVADRGGPFLNRRRRFGSITDMRTSTSSSNYGRVRTEGNGRVLRAHTVSRHTGGDVGTTAEAHGLDHQAA